MDQKYWRILIFRCRRKQEYPEKTYQGGYNHWLVALVKGKCSSTKATRLATGVVCHLDTEQNRPYKIPWPCQGLNSGTTKNSPSVPHYSTIAWFTGRWSLKNIFFSYCRQNVLPGSGDARSRKQPRSNWWLIMRSIKWGNQDQFWVILSQNLTHVGGWIQSFRIEFVRNYPTWRTDVCAYLTIGRTS